MASSDCPNPESLAVLSATVNQTLVEIGRFFRSSGSLKSRVQLKRSIPVAQEQFQDALDNLSEEIFMAKAFLERDYEAVLALKAPPESAHDAHDATMRKASDMEKSKKESPQPAVHIKTEKDTESNRPEAGLRQPSTSTANLTTVGEGGQSSNIPNAPIKVEKQPEVNTAAPGQSHPETGGEEINFESFLNNSNSGNEFDLHLDFGNDDVGNNNLNSNQFRPQENSIKPELQNATVGAGQQQQQQQQRQQQQQQQRGGLQEGQQPDKQGNSNLEEMMVPGESSFEDLFMDRDNAGGGGSGDQGLLEGDRLMNMSELDDSWFS